MSANHQDPSGSVRSSLDETHKPDHVAQEEEGVEPEQGNGQPLPLHSKLIFPIHDY